MGGQRAMHAIAVLAACSVGLAMELKDPEQFDYDMRDCIAKAAQLGDRDGRCRFTGSVGDDYPAVDLTSLTDGSRIPLVFQSDGVLVGLKAEPARWTHCVAFDNMIATAGYHACAPDQAESWIVRGSASSCTLQWGQDVEDPLYLELNYHLRLANMPVTNYNRRPSQTSGFCRWRLNEDGTVSPFGPTYPTVPGREVEHDGVLGLSRSAGQRGTDLILVNHTDPRRLVHVRADASRGPGSREYDCPAVQPQDMPSGCLSAPWAVLGHLWGLLGPPWLLVPGSEECASMASMVARPRAAGLLLSLLCTLWWGSCATFLSW